MSRAMKVAGAAAVVTVVTLYTLVEHGRTLGARRVLDELPNTASAVLRIDMRALGDNKSARALFERFVPKERLSEIEVTCGLAPLAALRDATVWVGGPDGEPLQSIGLVLRGRSADSEALAQCYRSLVEARGSMVDRLTTPTGPQLRSHDGRSALAKIDDQTVVTGSTETVAAFMAARRGTIARLSDQAQFADVWSRVGADAAIAAVFVAPSRWQAAFERIGAIGDQGSALAGVEAVGLTTRSKRQTTIQVVLDITDAATAQRDAALMRVWMESPPDDVDRSLVDAVRSAHVDVDGTRILLTLDASSFLTHGQDLPSHR